MVNPKLRLGIVGVGGMGIAHYHTEAFLRDGNVEIVACCDVQPDALAEYANRFNVPHRFSDFEAMLSASNLDIVVICTNELHHARMTVQAARHRPKAILCEKPMAMNLEEADAMLAACEANGVLLVIGHQRRYRSQYAQAKRLLDEGAIGDLVQIHSTGHAISSLLADGTHTIDLVRYFIGNPKAEWVFGQVEVRSGRQGWGHVLEDAALALIKFENGIRVWHTNGSHPMAALDSRDPAFKQRLYESALGTSVPFGYHRIVLEGTRGSIDIRGDGVGPLSPWSGLCEGTESKRFRSKTLGTRDSPRRPNWSVPFGMAGLIRYTVGRRATSWRSYSPSTSHHACGASCRCPLRIGAIRWNKCSALLGEATMRLPVDCTAAGLKAGCMGGIRFEDWPYGDHLGDSL